MQITRTILLLRDKDVGLFTRTSTFPAMEISASVVVYVGIAAIAFVVVYFLLKQLPKGQRSKLPTKPGTVVLHQFAPYDVVVSASPPCLKLETFLRMTKIPYENEYGLTFSKKRKNAMD